MKTMTIVLTIILVACVAHMILCQHKATKYFDVHSDYFYLKSIGAN